MWPHPEKLANKVRAIVNNIHNGNPMLKEVKHKDMSESEPEETPRELPNPKSSFVIPKVQRKIKRKRRVRKVREVQDEEENPTAYQMSETSDGKKMEPKGVHKSNKESDDGYEDEFEDDDKDKESDGYGDDEDFEDEEKEQKKEEEKEEKVDKIMKSTTEEFHKEKSKKKVKVGE